MEKGTRIGRGRKLYRSYPRKKKVDLLEKNPREYRVLDGRTRLGSQEPLTLTRRRFRRDVLHVWVLSAGRNNGKRVLHITLFPCFDVFECLDLTFELRRYKIGTLEPSQ